MQNNKHNWKLSKQISISFFLAFLTSSAGATEFTIDIGSEYFTGLAGGGAAYDKLTRSGISATYDLNYGDSVWLYSSNFFDTGSDDGTNAVNYSSARSLILNGEYAGDLTQTFKVQSDYSTGGWFGSYYPSKIWLHNSLDQSFNFSDGYDNVSLEIDVYGNYRSREGNVTTRHVLTLTNIEDAPIAQLSGDTQIGQNPFSIDAGASFDPDANGSIVSYQWDLDGDESYEYSGSLLSLNSASVDTLLAGYSHGDMLNAKLLITDDTGLDTIHSFDIFANARSAAAIWNGGCGDNLIGNSGCWAGGSVAGTSDTVLYIVPINTSSTTVLDGDVTHDQAVFKTGDHELQGSGGLKTYSLNASGAGASSGLIVGESPDDDAQLWVRSDAKISAINAQVGSSGGAKGDLRLLDGQLELSGALTVHDSGVFVMDDDTGTSMTVDQVNLLGGVFSVVSLDNITINSGFNFDSGSIHVGEAETFDVSSSGLLGSNIILDSGKTLNVGAIALDSGSALTLSGGRLSAHTIDFVGGDFIFDEGTLNLTSNADFIIGTTGTLNTNNLTLGIGSTGQDQIIDAATRSAIIETGSTLTIDGGWLQVGGLTNNGNLNLTSGDLTIEGGAFNPGTVGLIIDRTSGVDSDMSITLDEGATASFSSDVVVGDQGNGWLNVRDGSVFTVTNGQDLIVGNQLNSDGSVSVNDANLTVGGGLQVGVQGSGRVFVTNDTGGTAQVTTSKASNIGSSSDGGSVIIYGDNSSWSTSNHIYVNRGLLSVREGASVSAKFMTANGSGLNGKAVIRVNGEQDQVTTTLDVNGGVQIGYTGIGVLEIGAFGQADINSGLFVGEQGAVTIAESGNLDVDEFYLQGGGLIIDKTADFNATNIFQFDSGLIAITDDDLTLEAGGLFGNSLTISEDQAVLVSGTLSLSNASSSLTLNGGVLEIGDLSVGIGTFDFDSGGLNISGNLQIDTGIGPFGTNPNLIIDSDMALNVAGTTTLGLGGSIQLNGGTFTTGELVGNLDWASGVLAWVDDFEVGSAGALGTTVEVGADQVLDVAGRVTLKADSTMILGVDGVLNTQEFDATLGTFDWQSGTYLSGLHIGDLENNGGTLAPGNSPGHSTVEGDYTQGSLGELLIELGGLVAGDEYDVLEVTGTANLDGELEIAIWGDFELVRGVDYVFDILVADSITGNFSLVIYPELESVVWNLQQVMEGGNEILRLSAQVVPVPPAIWLFGSALAILGWRRKHTLQ